MKIKDNLEEENLPSRGRMYFSEEPISELFLIIDEVVKAEPVRCDCDSHNRCWNHRAESLVQSINSKLKMRISEVFEDDKLLLSTGERK